jgi:methyltransferase (TIGR00027 family)
MLRCAESVVMLATLPHGGPHLDRGAWQNEPVTAGLEDGGPSVTARWVAAHRLGFPRVSAPYGDPAADETLATDVAAGREAPLNRMHDYLAARTAFFDRIVVGAIGRGVRQIVVGAAGYDGRALRYAKSGVRWFEVDHPATQRDKRARLKRLGLQAPQVQFVEADFTRDPVAERLRAGGLDADAPGLFLLEGVAVYLEPAVLETVLDQFRQVAAAASRLAISVSLSGNYDEGARARFQASVAAMGEPARSTFDADEAQALLARHGWRIMAGREDPDDLPAAAKSRRQRSAGLLIASAGLRAPTPQAPATPQALASPNGLVPQVAGTLSLSALLSQALVAYTIEFDNEAEHRMPHRTTNFGASGHGDGTWLVSLAMWETCMRFVADQPITVGELRALARTGTNLDGMRRWGYITIDGTAKKVHRGRPGPDTVLRATVKGLRARQVWLPLAGLIEERWRERFGSGQVGLLRESLLTVVRQLDPGLPDCLPILGWELLSRGPDPALPPRADAADPGALPLSALLSRVLLSFAVEYERESALSLAVSANLLRVLDTGGTRLRDLPQLTGISSEAVSWAMGILVRGRLAVTEPDPAASRGKIARLAAGGVDAQRVYHEVLATVEQRWRDRFTVSAVSALRHALEALAVGSADAPPPLSQALEPYPGNWRAAVRRPVILPAYPMVLHRGGYPDGS